jgi:hypothetical protein
MGITKKAEPVADFENTLKSSKNDHQKKVWESSAQWPFPPALSGFAELLSLQRQLQTRVIVSVSHLGKKKTS